jgi:hypothetical protein
MLHGMRGRSLLAGSRTARALKGRNVVEIRDLFVDWRSERILSR